MRRDWGSTALSIISLDISASRFCRVSADRNASHPNLNPIAMAFISVSSFAGLSVQNRAARNNVCAAPTRAAKWTMDGKGFGGGEATRE